MFKRIRLWAALLVIAAMLAGCSNANQPNKAADSDSANAATTDVNAAFEPKLDTQKSVHLDAAVLFGNFEALDQVINHFNEFYPNVEITYAQLTSDSPDFIKNNASLDIFMTYHNRDYPVDDCADLKAAGVDFSAISDNLLKAGTVDGKVLTMPMGLTLSGLTVNKTLLAKEGLSVPETWSEFLDVLEALKQKGYTPLQGPTNAVGLLAYSMGMSMMGSDADLLNAVKSGDAAGAAKLKVMYERIEDLRQKGYFSDEVNAEYPNDNYDGAIMKFLEGDVPFWICETEKVSGVKKRESKSEAFSANPFEYEFIFAPMGDNGAYKYVEPWYGFAVNKNSDDLDYAIEFMRFMARKDELNTLSSIKGVPSIATESPDTRYANLGNTKAEMTVVSDGSVPAYFGTHIVGSVNKLISGEVADIDAALDNFVTACSVG